MTVDGHYNIHEGDAMSSEILYTAMSRGTRREYVHIVSKRQDVYSDSYRPSCIQVKARPVMLHIARIYRIDLSDGTSYIGETKQTLDERFSEHKTHPTNGAMATALDDAATIHLLEEFKYADEKQVFATEEHHIVRALAKGHKLLNVKHVPTMKEAEIPNKKLKVAKAPTISIKEDASKRRYEIRIQRININKEDQIRRFAWKDNKERAYLEAERWRSYLLTKYF